MTAAAGAGVGPGGGGGAAGGGPGGGGGGGGGGGLRQGFTVMCEAAEQCGTLYAGTADARVCVLDVERRRVVSEWLAAPVVRQYDPDDAITALCAPGGDAGGGAAGGGGGAGLAAPWLSPEVLAAGSRGGRVMVLDRRCGTAAMAFRAHGGGGSGVGVGVAVGGVGVGGGGGGGGSGDVASMAMFGSHVLVTAGGADRTLRLWDLRRTGAGGSSSSGSSTSAGHGHGGGGGGSGGASLGLVGSGYEERLGPWAGWEGPRCGGGAELLSGVADALSPAGIGAVLLAAASAADIGPELLVLPPPPPPALAAPLGGASAFAAAGGGVAAPALLRSFPLPREGASGLRVLRDCLLMTSGASVGVMSLAAAVGAEAGGAAGSVVAGAGAGAGTGAGAGPGFARLRNGRGGRESAGITGLGVLPCCRLLVVAGDDGAVRICR